MKTVKNIFIFLNDKKSGGFDIHRLQSGRV